VRWRIALAGLLALSGVGAAHAAEPQLVSDVSDRDIEIRASFHGATELVFGAILYPDGVVPDGQTDIAIVLRGPSQSIRLREKDKLGGLIWVNADETRFRSAPAFYAIATSRPIAKMVDRNTADIFELGLNSLQLSPSSGMAPEAARRFERGLIDLRRRGALYASQTGTVEITNGVLYRALIPIPARVPVGHYTAETFLIRHGQVLAATTRDVVIHKIGFERFVAISARAFPFIYGAVVVILSVLFGWAAGVLFKRI